MEVNMDTVAEVVQLEIGPFRHPPPSEVDLLEECPPRFKGENEWLHFMRLIICHGGVDISNWSFITKDSQTRKEQLMRFCSLLRSHGLNDGQKEWLGCWELAEMLSCVPAEYMPRKTA
jgi:hypothetical protein